MLDQSTVGGPAHVRGLRVEADPSDGAERGASAAVLHVDGEWVAVTWRAGAPVVIGHSTLAAPLVTALRARGYRPRVAFEWNQPRRYLAEPIAAD